MRFFILAAALVLAVTASPVQVQRDGIPVVYDWKYGEKCPAPFFYDNCNYCFCQDDGVSAGCTLKACLPPSQVHSRKVRSAPALPHIDNFFEVGQCTPGQMFLDNCNTCRCTPDGTNAVCTLIGCPALEKQRIDGYQNGNKCPAGKTFYNECNACQCGTDGLSALCTLTTCPSSQVKTRSLKPVDVPVVQGFKHGVDKCPAKFFYDDCNACTCMDDGYSAVCTLIFCMTNRRSAALDLPHIDNFYDIEQCTPGQSFYDNCNVCGCAKDGKSAACTRMRCAPNPIPRIDFYENGKKCFAGKAFYDRCNSCQCGADGVSAVCNKMACE